MNEKRKEAKGRRTAEASSAARKRIRSLYRGLVRVPAVTELRPLVSALHKVLTEQCPMQLGFDLGDGATVEPIRNTRGRPGKVTVSHNLQEAIVEQTKLISQRLRRKHARNLKSLRALFPAVGGKEKEKT